MIRFREKNDPWVRKIPWRREWLPTPVFLPGEFHGQRSLVGYSPWGCKELDMTEQLTFTLSHFFIGKQSEKKKNIYIYNSALENLKTKSPLELKTKITKNKSTLEEINKEYMIQENAQVIYKILIE